MPSAPLEILPVDPDDYTRISDIETAAFATSPISSAIFSRVSPSDRRAFARKRFPHELQNPQVHLLKAVRDGEIVGFAQWEVPLRQGQEAFHPRREDGPGWPAGTVVEEANAFYPKLDLGIKEPHYHLAILAVDPSFHRSGAGGALIRWGTEQADRDGLNVYLESSPGAVDVYPRFGFKPFREPIRGGTQSQLVVYPFRRPPQPAVEPEAFAPSPLPLESLAFLTLADSPSPSARSSVSIVPATTDDFKTLAVLQRRAFAPSHIARLIFGGVSEADHVEQWTGRMTKAISHPYKAVFKAVDAEGEIVGMALWETPKPEGYEEEKEERVWAPGTNVELAKELFSQLDFGMGQIPQYHLVILVVDPKRQRTGAGGALLRWGCRKADEAGVPCFLESTEAGEALYRRYGYQGLRAPVKAGPNKEIWLLPMTRPALSISPLLRSDIPSLPDIYQLSFRPTLINRYCFPAVLPLAYVPWITARITAALDAREKGEREDVLVAKRGEEEKASVEGYAWYSFAEAKGEREKKEGRTVRWFPEGAEVDRTQRFMWRMDDHKETIEEAHYSLDHLCVHPQTQGTGIGKLLTLKVMAKAKEEGVPLYLESTEVGVPFYTSLGFVSSASPLRSLEEPESDLLWPMVYRP